MQISAKVNIRKQIALGMAGSKAEEVLSSIKTVMAFDGQNKEIER